MKICIYGAGAIGGLLAAGLSRADGVEVSIVARGAHLDAIRADGLTLIRDGEETVARIAAASDPAELGRQDVIFNCYKAHQSWAYAEHVQPILGPDTAVVTCQSGVPWWYFYEIGGDFESSRLDSVDRDDRQWHLIGPERAIGCSVYPSAEIVAPGVIRHLHGDKFALGEPSGETTQRIRKIAALLNEVGFRAPVLDDIRSELWLKLWGHLCFNPISALTRATLDIVATDPGSRALARSMMLEGQAVAERLGATFRVDVERRINGAAKVGAHRTSMLQDLEAGKPMEIDALVTAVQEMGRIVGVPTPTIDGVLALVQQLARVQGLYPTYPDEGETA